LSGAFRSLLDGLGEKVYCSEAAGLRVDKTLEAIVAVVTGLGAGAAAVALVTPDSFQIKVGAGVFAVLSLLRVVLKWWKRPDNNGGGTGSRNVTVNIKIGAIHIHNIGSRNTHENLVVVGVLLPLVLYELTLNYGVYANVAWLGIAVWLVGLLLQYLDAFFSVTPEEELEVARS
jgi:hypothetical protein